MKITKDLLTDAQILICPEPVSHPEKMSTYISMGQTLKKFILMSSLAGAGLCFNACAPAYVASEPAYVAYERPAQPSNQHVWIDGNWVYQRQNHVYVQKNGYWVSPGQRRTYVSGHWKTSPRGHYWVAGHWQRRVH